MFIECIIVDNVVVEVFILLLVRCVVVLFVVFMGLVVDMNIIVCCNVFIDDVLVKGVCLLIGGRVNDIYMSLILLDGVICEMWLWCEEFFGLVKVIICVYSEEEVLVVVNDSEYGFFVVVYSCDSVRVWNVV